VVGIAVPVEIEVAVDVGVDVEVDVPVAVEVIVVVEPLVLPTGSSGTRWHPAAMHASKTPRATRFTACSLAHRAAGSQK
jgi:hypothetical protein